MVNVLGKLFLAITMFITKNILVMRTQRMILANKRDFLKVVTEIWPIAVQIFIPWNDSEVHYGDVIFHSFDLKLTVQNAKIKMYEIDLGGFKWKIFIILDEAYV